MSYADVTRLAGDLSVESLQSLRKTNKATKSESARGGEAEKSSLSGKDSVELQRAASQPDVETYQRIRSPELAAGVVQELSQQIMENTAEVMLAQGNLGSQMLYRLQQ